MENQNGLAPAPTNDLEPLADDSEVDRVEIKRLHDSIYHYAALAIREATRIGEILTRRKKLVGHGNWLPWLAANAEFTEVTACKYMALFEERDWLKSKPPSLDLTDAYRKIKEKRKSEKGSKPRGRGSRKASPSKVENPGQEPLMERSRGLTQEALRIFHRLWIQDTSILTLRTGESQKWVEKAQGSTAKGIAEDAYRLLKLSLSAAPLNVQAREEPPVDDSDQAGPPGPLVSVEQPEESKRTPHFDGMCYRKPKPYHITINDPLNSHGWVAAYTQLGIDGPSYYSGWGPRTERGNGRAGRSISESRAQGTDCAHVHSRVSVFNPPVLHQIER
jgi:hypothetical protein